MRGRWPEARVALELWLAVILLVTLPAVGITTVVARVPAVALNRLPTSPAITSGPVATMAPTASPQLVAGPHVEGPARLLFIGDSLTGGYYASDYWHSFPALVATRLRGQIVRSTIYYGHTAVNVIDEMNLVAPPSVDLAIVELGIDDIGESNLPTFRQDYAELMARLRRANPAVILVCLSLWQDQTAQVWDDTVRTLCTQAGGHFADIAPLYANEAYHGPLGRPTWVGPGDWFHPNDAGHAAIAAVVLRALAISA
jgi:lysophospholipase L1-like esterase